MTKEQIIQALRDDYAECMHRSASLDDPLRDEEYLEGVLDGRARGILHAIELIKQHETEAQAKQKGEHFAKVRESITLLQLYLSNDNWTAKSVLHIIVNGVEMEELTARVAIVKYGKARVRSFVENNVYLFTGRED